jgi:hypothetical protein
MSIFRMSLKGCTFFKDFVARTLSIIFFYCNVCVTTRSIYVVFVDFAGIHNATCLIMT